MAKHCTAELVMRCFESRTAAHLAHLRTRSYAAHKALDEYYHEIIEETDAFIEAYQGIYGLIDSYPDADEVEKATDVIAMLKGLRTWIRAHRDECCKSQSELENLLDGILDLIDGTLYKLQFLS